jgi:hypothetical protein
MAASIRLADAGLPEVPPPGSARIFAQEYGGRLHLKMLRPDGTIEVFGTLNLPLEVENGGTGSVTLPTTGQILIGDGTRYKPGNIIAGRKISINSTADSIEINAEVQDFSVTLYTPPEFTVERADSLGATTLSLNKVVQEAHKIYAGPINGANAEPTFRALVEDDIPSLNSSKITQFEDRVRESTPLGLDNSAEISFNYNQADKKTAFSLNPTGVIAGTYGSGLQIPVITVDSNGRITTATTVDAKEAVEDYVGALVHSSESVNAEYDDLNSKLFLHINNESIITTNVSNNENVRAPTSQAIKQYIDDNVDAERNSRISADFQLQNAITTLQSQVGTDLQTKISQIEQTLADYAVQDTVNLQQAVAAEQARAISAETALQNSVSALQVQVGSDLQQIITQLSADLAAESAARLAAEEVIKNKVDKGLVIPKSDVFNITAQNLTNGYVLLSSNQILSNSAMVMLGRTVLLEGIDFSVTPLPTDSSRLTFLPGLPVDTGEVLKVNYLYTESLDVNIFARYDNYVISAQDIERGYLVLSNQNALFESVSAFVDRVPLLQGFDFVISKNSDNNVIFTFMGDILPNQQLALEVGENIRVNYLYRN